MAEEFVSITLEEEVALINKYGHQSANKTIKVKKDDLLSILGKKEILLLQKLNQETIKNSEKITLEISEIGIKLKNETNNLSTKFKTELSLKNKELQTIFDEYSENSTTQIETFEKNIENINTKITQSETRFNTKFEDFEKQFKMQEDKLQKLITDLQKQTNIQTTSLENTKKGLLNLEKELNEKYKQNLEELEKNTRKSYGITKDAVQTKEFENRKKELYWRVILPLVLFILVIFCTLYLAFCNITGVVFIPLTFISFTLYNWYNQERMILEKYAFKTATSGTLRQTINMIQAEFFDQNIDKKDQIADLILKTTDEIYNTKPYQNQVINQVVEMTFGWLKINRNEKHHDKDKSKN